VEFTIVIPARIGSKRLKRKPLVNLLGKPLILWVLESARKITDSVIVATDSEEVKEIVERAGGAAIITPSDLPSGTDRVYRAVQEIEAELIVNLQGDEPFVKEEHVFPIVRALLKGEEYATVATLLKDIEELHDPSKVKVVVDNSSHALYFSRSPIPYFRDGEPNLSMCLKHIGIYGYTRQSLEQFVKWPVGKLEKAEKLEQLRILENGRKIHVSVVKEGTFGIDTEEDLKLAEKMLKGENRWLQS